MFASLIFSLLLLSTIQALQYKNYEVTWKLHKRKYLEFSISRAIELNAISPASTGNQNLFILDLERLWNQRVSGNEEWFAIGFNPKKKTMIQSDFIVLDSSVGKICELSDEYAEGQTIRPHPDTDLGCQNNIEVVKKEILVNGNQIVMNCTFNRFLNTRDRCDLEIKDETLFFLYGMGLIQNGQRQKHQKTTGNIEINFFTDQQNENVSNNKNYMILLHGVFFTIAWLILMWPVSLMARYFKSAFANWFFIHWKVQVLAILFIITGAILIFIRNLFNLFKERGWYLTDVHQIFGFVILLFIPCQLYLGYLSNKLWFKGKLPHFIPDKLHWYLGHLILLAGLVNIFLGFLKYWEFLENDLDEKDLDRAEKWYKALYAIYGVWVGLMLVGVLVLQIRVGQQHEHLLLLQGEEEFHDDHTENEESSLLRQDSTAFNSEIGQNDQSEQNSIQQIVKTNVMLKSLGTGFLLILTVLAIFVCGFLFFA